VVKGARTVVEAVAYSKKVAEAMHEYMQSLPPVEAVPGGGVPDGVPDGVPCFRPDDGN
jgi:glutamate synthase (NADPH/NADH) small chain